MCSVGGWIPFGPVYLLLCACLVGQRVRLFAAPWPVALQAALPMGFYRQDCWSGLLFPSPGIEPVSPALQGDSLPAEPSGKPLFTTIYPIIWQHNYQRE